MKKICTLIIACFLSTVAINAQQTAEEADFFKALFGVEKIELVKDFIKVDAANEVAFWETYKEFETNRKELRTERIALINDYAENYANLSDEKIDELAKRSIKLNKKSAKNVAKYYKKLNKIGGAKAAAQFLQIENYFVSLSKTAIYENIPFIGELDAVE